LLQQSLIKNWPQVFQALRKADFKKTGLLKKKELKTVIENFTISLSDDHFQQLVLKFYLWISADKRSFQTVLLL
jgi:Ca2+-binding EF-hand superfamily protein